MNTVEYDVIPGHVLGKKLLELGGRDGKRQLHSKNRDYFMSCNWLNVDRDMHDLANPPFKFLHRDINSLESSRWIEEFDTILLIEVLEHVDIRNWPKFIDKLKNWLKPNGYLVITCPYKERLDQVLEVYPGPDQDHTVFMIDKKLIKRYLPDAQTRIFRQWVFRNGNEFILKSLLRYIKRLVLGHYFVNGYLPGRRKMLVTWRKTG